MSKKSSGVNWNKSSKTKQRRKNVIDRLEKQLESKSKVTKECKSGETVLLNDSDIKRINKELIILKERI